MPLGTVLLFHPSIYRIIAVVSYCATHLSVGRLAPGSYRLLLLLLRPLPHQLTNSISFWKMLLGHHHHHQLLQEQSPVTSVSLLNGNAGDAWEIAQSTHPVQGIDWSTIDNSMSVCPSAYLTLSVCLYFSISACLCVCVCLIAYGCIHLFVSVCVCLFVCVMLDYPIACKLGSVCASVGSHVRLFAYRGLCLLVSRYV